MLCVYSSWPSAVIYYRMMLQLDNYTLTHLKCKCESQPVAVGLKQLRDDRVNHENSNRNFQMQTVKTTCKLILMAFTLNRNTVRKSLLAVNE